MEVVDRLKNGPLGGFLKRKTWARKLFHRLRAPLGIPINEADAHLATAHHFLHLGDIESALGHYEHSISSAIKASGADAAALPNSEAFVTAVRSHHMVAGIREKVIQARHRLRQTGNSIVAEARGHLETSLVRQRPSEILPNEFWAKCLGVVGSDMPRLVTAEDVLFYLTDCFNINVINHEVQAQLYYQTLEAEFPRFNDVISRMECSPYLRPNRLVVWKGRLVSSGFFGHLRSLLTCLSWTGRPRIVCEIGGGYGGLALLWMTNPRHNPDLYILIDFPESLFFAEVFLKANHPTAKTLYLDRPTPLDPSIVREYDCILCPSDCVGALSSLRLDLVINLYSFQEMSDAGLNHWMDWLEHQDCQLLYSLQIFGLPLTQTRTAYADSALWAPRLRKYWHVRFQNFNPNPMLQYGSPVAEVIAEKFAVGTPRDSGNPASMNLRVTRYPALQQLLEELDLVRLETDEEQVLEFLRRWTRDLEWTPREVYAVSLSLDSTASPEFRRAHGAELDRINQELAALHGQAKTQR